VPTSSNLSPDFQVCSLSVQYPDCAQPVISELSFELRAGESLGIHGANAAGKSSLIHALCGVIPHYIRAERSGEMYYKERSLMEMPLCEIYRIMAVSLSDTKSQFMFPTVEHELAFAMENMAIPAPIIRQRVDSAAARFGIAPLLNKAPLQLSGGEQKLVILAMCDALDSPILLLDEPERGLSPNPCSYCKTGLAS
jgi:energy-coupling factor transporter ATP-binding protein EcfA2